MDYLIIGNKNAIICKGIFQYVINNQLWFGINRPSYFSTPGGEITKSLNGLCRWFTNLEHAPAGKPLILDKRYSPEDYKIYDNYNAIEVSRVKDIPLDYDGVMGVPVTYIDRPHPDYSIVGIGCGNSWKNYREELEALGFDPEQKYGGGLGTPILNGKAVYSRIFIKKKRAERHVGTPPAKNH